MLLQIILAVNLIQFTGPENQVVEINPAQVVTTRKPRNTEGHFNKNIKCLIHTTDGKYVAVVEDCEVVHQRLETNREDGP